MMSVSSKILLMKGFMNTLFVKQSSQDKILLFFYNKLYNICSSQCMIHAVYPLSTIPLYHLPFAQILHTNSLI